MKSRASAACAILAAIACALAANASRAAPASDVPQVLVSGGRLAGVASGAIVAFEGVPYAQPPVGELRWRAPRPARAWSGVRAANDFGPSCPQSIPRYNVPPGSRAAGTSEDCLTLNVWTGGKRGDALPVMVWLHGGSNTSGSGSDRFYDGSSFARDGVVLVTLNYRLGPLGFFAHPALVREPGYAGANFGLLDQIAALRWVRENVAAFGGDPSRITVFGESAGGEDTLALVASPAARGLFARAIAESAADVWSPWTPLREAEIRGATIAAHLGVPLEGATPAQLRALKADALSGADADDTYGPIVDGRVVEGPLAKTLANARLPVVIGTNDGDGSVIGNVPDVAHLFPRLSSADLATLRAQYGAAAANDAAFAVRLFGDGAFAAPARTAALTVARAGQPAYLYRFDYVASFFAGRRSIATHGSEIPYVFDTWPAYAPLSDADRAVTSAIHGCWVAFATTGRPDCAGAPGWTSVDPRGALPMVFAGPIARRAASDDAVDLLQAKLPPG